MLILFLGLLLLSLSPVGGEAATVSIEVEVTPARNQAAEALYKRACRLRLESGQSLLPNCAANCVTCTPSAANKEALIKEKTERDLDAVAQQIIRQKAKATADKYLADPSVRAGVDAQTGVGEPDL